MLIFPIFEAVFTSQIDWGCVCGMISNWNYFFIQHGFLNIFNAVQSYVYEWTQVHQSSYHPSIKSNWYNFADQSNAGTFFIIFKSNSFCLVFFPNFPPRALKVFVLFCFVTLSILLVIVAHSAVLPYLLPLPQFLEFRGRGGWP